MITGYWDKNYWAGYWVNYWPGFPGAPPVGGVDFRIYMKVMPHEVLKWR